MRRNHSILLLSLILLEFISFCSIYAFINSQSIAFYYHNFLIIASFVICINPEKGHQRCLVSALENVTDDTFLEFVCLGG